MNLLHAGVYRSIANALRAEPLRTASFVMLVKSLGAADNFVRKPNEMLIKSQLAVVDRMASFYHEQKADDELHAVAKRGGRNEIGNKIRVQPRLLDFQPTWIGAMNTLFRGAEAER